MAASATFALKAGVWFRRGRLLIISPDSRGTACPLSGRNSTYRPVQILEPGSIFSPHHLIQTPQGTVEQEATPRIILMDAWRKHLPIHGSQVEYTLQEEQMFLSGDEELIKTAQRMYEHRAKPQWGLVE